TGEVQPEKESVFATSPDGSYRLSARETILKKDGVTHDLMALVKRLLEDGQDYHIRQVEWSPDGKELAFVADKRFYGQTVGTGKLEDPPSDPRPESVVVIASPDGS